MYKSIKKWRAAVLVFLTHNMALPLLRLVRRPEKFPYKTKELALFAEGTIGKDLFNFLENKQLDLLPFYARHDMKHILLDYDTTEEGEGCLQCFMLGNGHISFPVLATVLYCFCTMPEYWRSFRAAYSKGKQVAPIAHWPWFQILQQPTLQLKKAIYESNPVF